MSCAYCSRPGIESGSGKVTLKSRELLIVGEVD